LTAVLIDGCAESVGRFAFHVLNRLTGLLQFDVLIGLQVCFDVLIGLQVCF